MGWNKILNQRRVNPRAFWQEGGWQKIFGLEEGSSSDESYESSEDNFVGDNAESEEEEEEPIRNKPVKRKRESGSSSESEGRIRKKRRKN